MASRISSRPRLTTRFLFSIRGRARDSLWTLEERGTPRPHNLEPKTTFTTSRALCHLRAAYANNEKSCSSLPADNSDRELHVEDTHEPHAHAVAAQPKRSIPRGNEARQHAADAPARQRCAKGRLRVQHISDAAHAEDGQSLGGT